MKHQDKKNLRALIFSKELVNIEIGIKIAKVYDFKLPNSWQKEIRKVKLANHKIAYELNQCTFGKYAGVIFDKIPLIELAKMMNYGVFGKAEQCKYPSRHFWAIVYDSLNYRQKEIVKSIKKRKGLKFTKSGYYDEFFYQGD